MSLIENQMPPEQLAALTPEQKTFLENQIRQQMQNPQAQQQIQVYAEMLQGLNGVTPTYNEAGDRATFQVPTPDSMRTMARNQNAGADLPSTLPVTFVKRDGKWYMNGGGF